MARVTYSRRARMDLSQIWAWIARSSGDRRADDVISRIVARIATLEDHPLLGPAHPEIDEAARMLVVMRWVVVYAAHEDNVRIVRVLDAASDVYRRLGK